MPGTAPGARLNIDYEMLREATGGGTMSEQHESQKVDEDRQLVRLVNNVLVDPNLHTDQRLRLAHEITGVLRAAHEAVYGPEGSEAQRRAHETRDNHVPSLVEATLVDPNLHTDTRMHLHQQISAILSGHVTS